MRGAPYANPHTLEIRLKAAQMTVFTCEKRFRVLVAGRRFGKTYLALLELLRGACAPNRVVWYVAPTYKQGKRIAWNRLKQLTPALLGRVAQRDRSEYHIAVGQCDRAARSGSVRFAARGGAGLRGPG